MKEYIQEIMKKAFDNQDFSMHKQLSVLNQLIAMADDESIATVYWTVNCNGIRKGLEVTKIPGMIQSLGYDFSLENVQNILRGMQLLYENAEFYDRPNISVSTTHDLNHASILDVRDLLFDMQYTI